MQNEYGLILKRELLTARDELNEAIKQIDDEEASWNRHKKKRRVTIPIHREWSDVLALLDAAFLKDYVVSIAGLYEERDAFVFVTSKKDVKVEDDQ